MIATIAGSLRASIPPGPFPPVFDKFPQWFPPPARPIEQIRRRPKKDCALPVMQMQGFGVSLVTFPSLVSIFLAVILFAASVTIMEGKRIDLWGSDLRLFFTWGIGVKCELTTRYFTRVGATLEANASKSLPSRRCLTGSIGGGGDGGFRGIAGRLRGGRSGLGKRGSHRCRR